MIWYYEIYQDWILFIQVLQNILGLDPLVIDPPTLVEDTMDDNP